MSEMVERVAKAIDDAIARWQPGSDQRIKDMAARAAIEAMREPTPAMRSAILIESERTNRYCQSKVHHAIDCWQVMIDEALK